jgi:hypothetical protein
VPLLRVQVSDAETAPDLHEHLTRQGFPASLRQSGELTVLFPGRPSIFAPAVELDLWHMNHPAVTVTVVDEGGGASELLRS